MIEFQLLIGSCKVHWSYFPLPAASFHWRPFQQIYVPTLNNRQIGYGKYTLIEKKRLSSGFDWFDLIEMLLPDKMNVAIKFFEKGQF